MKIKTDKNRLIFDSKRRALIKLTLALAIVILYVSLIPDFAKNPAENIGNILISSVVLIMTGIYGICGGHFVSSLEMDPEGIKEIWLFVFAGNRIRWRDVEDYDFEYYHPYRAGPPPFRRVVFTVKTETGKRKRLISPCYSVKKQEHYERQIRDFCEGCRENDFFAADKK